MNINFNAFFKSVMDRQNLINIIITHINEGERKISKVKLGKEIGKSTTWVNNAIKQINTEEPCIVYNNHEINLKYTNLMEKGVYTYIYKILLETEKDNSLLYKNNKEICEMFTVKEKTVQMYRAYAKIK